VETLAEYAGVPVFNELTDKYHSTPMPADVLTMGEHSNNVANSLLLAGAKLGWPCGSGQSRPDPGPRGHIRKWCWWTPPHGQRQRRRNRGGHRPATGSYDIMGRVSALVSVSARLSLGRLYGQLDYDSLPLRSGTRYAPAWRPQAMFAARSTSSSRRRLDGPSCIWVTSPISLWSS
jgi:hypothetical protein